MTPEERQKLFNKLKETNEVVETIDTLLPSELESSGEVISTHARDESNLTYEQLIEDYHTFNKPAVMTLKTFERLWNS